MLKLSISEKSQLGMERFEYHLIPNRLPLTINNFFRTANPYTDGVDMILMTVVSAA
jgi:hypothetical protein